MKPEEGDPLFSDLPEARWSDEEVVDHDIPADLVRDATGILSELKHEERSKETPDPRAIERISDRQEKLSENLRDLRITDAEKADRLRVECLAIIKTKTL